jgi:hypothetical protein
VSYVTFKPSQFVCNMLRRSTMWQTTRPA